MNTKLLKLRVMGIRVSMLITSLLITGCGLFVSERTQYDYDKMDSTTERIHKKVESFLKECTKQGIPVRVSPYTRIDSVIVDEETEQVDIYFNRLFAHIPFREQTIDEIQTSMQEAFGWWDNNYTFTIHATNNTIEELIPNFYRSDRSRYDLSRLAKPKEPTPQIVRKIDKPSIPVTGLNGKHIALWHSHGWYYEPSLNRWEWQRARLFQSVEDLGPMSFTIPYLVPMLENAGASVFLPRERDLQVHEAVIDNNSYIGENSDYIEINYTHEVQWAEGVEPGFAIGYPPYGAWINPFRQGSYRYVEAAREVTAEINWIPDFPVAGRYAVYVSYASSDSNITDAHYSVYHKGGRTTFLVNQRMGGGTWIYLGQFNFDSGQNSDIGKVLLTNQSKESGRVVTADAVRFGGGMGNIIRDGQISGRPRYMEAARYYLQYAGMPDTLVYTLSGNKHDYSDDYRSRGEWVNYLIGAPFGPNKNRQMKGLGIPIDLSLAFHTDAGLTEGDTVVGTLSIYSTYDADSSLYFPDGVSRFANRDFADIMQTQIVEDLRKTHDPVWNRRGLWDREYSEAFRPNIPAALLELLSHQNFLDMKFHQDPLFKFSVSRSIYKSMLKFLATQNGETYVVQPLPVTNFIAIFEGPGKVYLKWKPQIDPLEETAIPEQYIVYTRESKKDFDNGRLATNTHLIIEDISPDVVYSFKITAVNDGGESFPSEILSVCWLQNKPDPVLVVNGFDRVAAPEGVETDTFKGFLSFLDAGVPDRYDLSFVGTQFNFNPSSKWTDDDAPGFGSSYADMETKIIHGNTFDFSYIHGEAIRQAGYSFVSVSDEAAMEDEINLADFDYIDLILGEEKKTFGPKKMNGIRFKTIPDSLRKRLIKFCDLNGNLFISGAYVGTDLFQQAPVDTLDIHFARKYLKYFLRTNHAVKSGDVFAVDTTFKSTIPSFKFNTSFNADIYMVEAPDAIEPVDSTSQTLIRYSENNMSAAVGFQGDYNVVVFGFPFETILGQEAREKVMQAVFRFLNNKPEKSPPSNLNSGNHNE